MYLREHGPTDTTAPHRATLLPYSGKDKAAHLRFSKSGAGVQQAGARAEGNASISTFKPNCYLLQYQQSSMHPQTAGQQVHALLARPQLSATSRFWTEAFAAPPSFPSAGEKRRKCTQGDVLILIQAELLPLHVFIDHGWQWKPSTTEQRLVQQQTQINQCYLLLVQALCFFRLNRAVLCQVMQGHEFKASWRIFHLLCWCLEYKTQLSCHPQWLWSQHPSKAICFAPLHMLTEQLLPHWLFA